MLYYQGGVGTVNDKIHVQTSGYTDEYMKASKDNINETNADVTQKLTSNPDVNTYTKSDTDTDTTTNTNTDHRRRTVYQSTEADRNFEQEVALLQKSKNSKFVKWKITQEDDYE